MTLEHDLDLLREMNTPRPHTVATHAGEVVGYALVLLESMRDRLPRLAPMFAQFEEIELDGRPLASLRWFVMGQICVAAAHRGRGLRPRLYDFQCIGMAADFDCAVTGVAAANPRSLRAHEGAGYGRVDEYEDPGGARGVVLARRL